jgi:hypothetical protein
MGRLNPVTPVRDPLPKNFGARSASIFAQSSNGDTCIFTCVPVAMHWLFFLTNNLFLSIESFTPNLLIVFSWSCDVKSQNRLGDSPVLRTMFEIVYFNVIVQP